MEKAMRIDFHAHVLPQMDHGCSSVEMSLQQMKLAAEAGIEMVVATSHFYPHVHTLDEFVAQRATVAAKIRKVIQGKEEFPKLVLGAEVLICNNLDKMPGLKELCVEESNVMLVEFPFSAKWELELVETAIRLKQSGFQIVLAHADRYHYDEVMKLVDAGIDLQLNADSVCSMRKYGLCKKYIRTGKVVALGSDIHGLSNEYKNYAKAIKRLGQSAEIILERTQEVLEGCKEVFCGKG